MTNFTKKTAILISGRGSNMQSLIQATNQPDYPATISLVISNNSNAIGLKFAKESGIPTQVLTGENSDSQESYDQNINEVLERFQIELVCLAGFMRIVSAWFVKKWYGRLINIHPSLLPAFIGLNTHKRALESGVNIHGCTVHFVTAELDAGPIIIQGATPVFCDDNEKSLASRVLEIEHVIYPKALAMLASNMISIDSPKTTFKTGETTVPSLIVPTL